MPLNRQAGALFPADHQFVLADQFADVFETDRGFVDRHAMLFRHGVNQVRSSDTAGHPSFQFADTDQVIQQQGDDVIGFDVAAVGINDAETVGIAVSGQTKPDIGIFLDQRNEIGNVSFGWLGRVSAKVRIGAVIDHGVWYAALTQWLFQITASGSIHRIERHLPQPADHIKIDLLLQGFQVLFAGIDNIQQTLLLCCLKGKFIIAGRSKHPVGTLFDIAGGFRKGRTSPGR